MKAVYNKKCIKHHETSGAHKLKFDQLYCINEQLVNDGVFFSKICLGYEEALWPKNWR